MQPIGNRAIYSLALDKTLVLVKNISWPMYCHVSKPYVFHYYSFSCVLFILILILTLAVMVLAMIDLNPF